MRPAAIVFDLWYTLIGPEDFRPVGYGSTSAIVTELGLDRDHFVSFWSECLDVRQRTPRRLREYIVDYMTEIDRTMTDDELERFDAVWGYHDQALANPRADVVAALRSLAHEGYRIGVLSNAHEREMRTWRTSPLAELVDAVCLSFDIGCMKPEPEAFERVLSELGVAASDAVFVGDGASGELEGARRAGFSKAIFMRGLIAEYGVAPETLEALAAQADATIDAIGELGRLISESLS